MIALLNKSNVVFGDKLPTFEFLSNIAKDFKRFACKQKICVHVLNSFKVRKGIFL